MRPKKRRQRQGLDNPAINDVPRAPRRSFSVNDKIGFVIRSLQGKDSVARFCRKEGIARSRYYAWAKEYRADCERRLAELDAHAAIGDSAGGAPEQ